MICIFEQTVAEKPDAPAVHYFDDTITFKQLDDKAGQFAALLDSWGVGHGDRVAISAQNDPEFLVVQYGAWKRGRLLCRSARCSKPRRSPINWPIAAL